MNCSKCEYVSLQEQVSREVDREGIEFLLNQVRVERIKRRFTKPQHTHNLDLLAIEMEKEGHSSY